MSKTETVIARWLGALGAGFGAIGAVLVGAGSIPDEVTIVVVAIGAGLSGLVTFIVKSAET